MNEDFDDYVSEEEIKIRIKQEKCEHKDIIVSKKCKCCGKWWSEKNLHLGFKNEIINKEK